MTFTNILCEAVCFYSNFTQKYTKSTSIDNLGKNCRLKKGVKWRVEKNKSYIDPKHRPRWCLKCNKKREPQFYCLGPIGGRKCPFLLISDCRQEEYDFMHYGLVRLEKMLVKKFGKMFDYEKAMPFSKKEQAFQMKVLKEFEKERSLGPLKRKGIKP